MLHASALLKAASAYSQTFSQRVDILRGGRVIIPGVPVVSGTIHANRTSAPRMSLDMVLGIEPWKPLGFDNRTCQLRVWRGVESLGYTESLSQGVFRIDDIDRTPDGQIALTGSGLESYCIDGRMVIPQVPPYGTSTVEAIKDLIRDVLPRATFRVETTRDMAVTAIAPWERDRWDAIDDLAASIECDVYADARGDFVIRDTPYTTGQPQLWVRQGEGGLMVDQQDSSTRDQVYNAAVAMNQTTVPGAAPVWAMVTVNDPTDDLFYGGEFGKVPLFHLSQWYTASWQCERYANKLLIDAVSLNNRVQFATPPTVWWLEVGDRVGIEMLDGSREVHLLQSMDADLGPEGVIQFETLSTKRTARLDDFPGDGTIE